MAAFLSDWRARDGTIVGVEVRHGDSPISWYLVADIRDDDPLHDSRLAAWCEGHAVQDLRGADLVTLHDGPAVQHLVAGVASVPHTVRDVARERQRRAARQGASPLPVGGLFDEVSRAQLDMFA